MLLLARLISITGILFPVFILFACSKNSVEDKDLGNFVTKPSSSEKPYTIIEKNDLAHIVSESDKKIIEIINQVNSLRKQYQDEELPKDKANNKLIRFLSSTLDGINYTYTDATGEWNGSANALPEVDCIGSITCVQQAPVYRTDKLDCFTLVNLIVAVLNSTNLEEFKRIS